MANNIIVLDSSAVGQTLKTTDNGGVHTPHHNVDSEGVLNPTGTFTRPADTTAYASGDLMANSTTAGSVTPMTFTVARAAAGWWRNKRVRLKKSTASLTLATFRLHLYTTTPTPANGDNAAWSTDHAGYIGNVDIDMATLGKAFTDPAAQVEVTWEFRVKLASGTTIRGLLEARAAYAPGNAEVFTVTLEGEQD